MFRQLGVAFLQVAFLSFVLTAFILHFARKYHFVDQDPHHINDRQNSVASYGGVAIYLSFWIGVSLLIPQFFHSSNHFWLWLASSIILIVGILDDQFELNALQKSIGILIAANLLYFKADISFLSALLPNVNPLLFQIISYTATMIWIFGVTNAINLIDGVDGLASSVSIVSLLTLLITTYFFSLSIRLSFLMMLLILIASILGFLPFNWAPAKIYLGDTGALFIGFMYAALSVSNLKNASVFSLLVPVLIYMLPLFDTGYAMMRRVLIGQPIGQADHEHLHHRLLRFGFSKRQVVWAMIFITIIFSAIAIAAHIWLEWRLFWLILTICVIMGLVYVMHHLAKKNKEKEG